MSNQYPKDEFDRAGEDMPVGMHRPQPSKWKSVLPFLLVLVLVPLLGWGASLLLTSRGVVTPESGSSSPSQSGPVQSGDQDGGTTGEEDQSGASTPPPAATPTPTPTPSESPAAEVDHNVVISVLNGTGTQGLAGEKAALLNQAGFAGTSAANADGWETTVTT
ncbi:MAG: LytR C-terminal domain-containing protein, partial [Actinomyces sp.]|nr:LytR C-terminal domain-containing protein [Actinomyces sp.]